MVGTWPVPASDLAPETLPGPEIPTDPPQPNPRLPYLRTILETSVILGTASYWYRRHPAPSDSDLSFDWTSWREKLFSDKEITFDDNRFNTNALLHPLTGAVTFQIARGNGFGFVASLLASTAGSFAWEYLTEYNEKPSLNDLVFTPAGGAVLGEATYRLGRLFYAGAPTLPNCLGALLFSPVATLDDAAVCRGRPGDPPYDELGLSRRTWRRLHLDLGRAHSVFAASDQARDETAFALGAEVISNRRYRRPGVGAVTVAPGQWTALEAEGLVNEGAVRGLAFHSHTILFGRYLRSYGDVEAWPGAAEPQGHGLLAGIGSAFDYDARDLPFARDKVTSIGLLGPMLDLAVRHGAVALRLSLAAHYSFSIVESLAYPLAAADYNGTDIKSALRQQGYYYAQGVIARGALTMETPVFEVMLDGHGGAFWSINARDRFQREIGDDFALSDTRLVAGATAATRPLGGFRVALRYQEVRRTSRVPRYLVTGDEKRVGLSVVTSF